MSSAKYNRREEQGWLSYIGSLLTVVYALTQSQIIHTSHTSPYQLLPTTLHLPPANTCTEPRTDKI
jgi:hypothetical protein